MSRITAHALVRWMERVHGIDTQPMRRAIGCGKNDGALLRYIHENGHLNVDLLKQHILDRDVVAALDAGATAIRRPPVWMVAQAGKIVTVLGEGQRPRNRARKIGAM